MTADFPKRAILPRRRNAARNRRCDCRRTGNIRRALSRQSRIERVTGFLSVRPFNAEEGSRIAAPTGDGRSYRRDVSLRSPIGRTWRKRWDSNPRYGETVNQISSLAHSTTLPPFLVSLAPASAGRRRARDSMRHAKPLARQPAGAGSAAAASGAQYVRPAEVRSERGRNGDAAVGLLEVLQHRDQRAADGQPRAVERVHELVAVRRPGACESASACAAPGTLRSWSTS